MFLVKDRLIIDNMAHIIKVDGTIVPMETQGVVPLEALQKAVGGLIQIIPIKDEYMIIDEEGKFKNGGIENIEATKLAQGYIFDEDYIAGDVVICSSNEIE